MKLDQAIPVTRMERTWVDASRKTPRTANYEGAEQRTLRVLIWRPADTRPAPLLVMAHGFGGLPEKFDAFARSVAGAGFVVAAPAFPLTNENAPGGHDVGLRDFVNQPADLTFVITQLLQATDSSGDALEGAIAPQAIAVLGHSLGGVTVIALTRKNCCRDARVRASILAATPLALANAFGNDSIAAGPPTLIVHGTADHNVDYSDGPRLYGMIEPPRFLLGLNGAGHSEAFESQIEPPIPARDAAQRASVAFLNAVLRGAGAGLDATLESLSAEGNFTQADKF